MTVNENRDALSGEYTKREYTTPDLGVTRDLSESALPQAVHPAGCGCADCETGVSVPLDDASRAALDDILYGNLVANRTGLSFQQIKDFIWSECGD